jgi:hypothetical protein
MGWMRIGMLREPHTLHECPGDPESLWHDRQPSLLYDSHSARETGSSIVVRRTSYDVLDCIGPMAHPSGGGPSATKSRSPHPP